MTETQRSVHSTVQARVQHTNPEPDCAPARATDKCPGCGDELTECELEYGVCHNCHGTTDDPHLSTRERAATLDTVRDEYTCATCGSHDLFARPITVHDTRQDPNPQMSGDWVLQCANRHRYAGEPGLVVQITGQRR
jgi:hypothetical protein